jgi:hypothetical protein
MKADFFEGRSVKLYVYYFISMKVNRWKYLGIEFDVF